MSSNSTACVHRWSYFRVVIAINGDHDAGNGLHVIDGNGGSTNYRTMSVSGNLQLKKGQYASVYVYSSFDNSYTVNSESGECITMLDPRLEKPHQAFLIISWSCLFYPHFSITIVLCHSFGHNP